MVPGLDPDCGLDPAGLHLDSQPTCLEKVPWSSFLNLASAKNFQLEPVDKPDKIKLLFGKVGGNQFVLDFHRPLSMVQAFAAAVTTNVWK